MNYAKEYKEALERAKLAIKECGNNKGRISMIESIFPELGDSEDERVRKDIMILVKDWWDRVNKDNISTKEEMITWLEKQGEPIDKNRLAKCVLIEVANSIMRWLDANCAEGNMCLSNMECEDIENAVRNADWEKVYGYMKKKLERQCEQKPTDKAEPKFKFGDWIVNNNSKDVFLIKSTNSGYCTLESIKGNIISPCLPPCESESHIWTIQDVGDGDVLYSPMHHLIWIYKDDKHYYVCINLNYTSNNISVDGSISIPNDVCPATKEQRDTLEKAMADAGYTFNFDKKSLKKIYQKPAWSEEDEDNLRYSELHFKTFLSNTYYDTFCNWLKSLRTRLGGK